MNLTLYYFKQTFLRVWNSTSGMVKFSNPPISSLIPIREKHVGFCAFMYDILVGVLSLVKIFLGWFDDMLKLEHFIENTIKDFDC